MLILLGRIALLSDTAASHFGMDNLLDIVQNVLKKDSIHILHIFFYILVSVPDGMNMLQVKTWI